MSKITSIILDDHFNEFIKKQVKSGKYASASEVIRAALMLFEKEENKTIALKAAIQKGLDSPRVEDFDFKENLRKLKEEKVKNG